MRLLFVVVLCAGCSKEPEAPPAPAPAVTAAPSVEVLPRDNVAILTDALVESYLAAVADDAIPLSTLLTREPKPTFDDLPKRLLELDALAKKHGFRDVKEFEAVSWRITTGHLQLMTERMTAGALELLQASNAADEEELARPDLDAARRAELEERLKRGRQSVAGMKDRKSDSTIPAADIAIIAKYRDRIAQTERKIK